MDVVHLEPGVDFVDRISQVVGTCHVVIIGPRWLDCTDDSGQCRLTGADDFVRLEVKVGLTGSSSPLDKPERSLR